MDEGDRHAPRPRDRAPISSALRGWFGTAATALLVCLVRFYQVGIAPLLIGTCKFCPSCSEYFIEAVQVHGPLRGAWLGIRRLARCHPFSHGGIDPVPPRV